MKLPAPRRRPKFAQWRYERGLTLRGAADMLEGFAGHRICSHETIRIICLPFGHADRLEPSPELAEAIEGLTQSEVTAADFRLPVSAAA